MNSATTDQFHDPYAALRYPNYRRYYIGQACALLGTQMTTYTVAYELYARSNSSLVLGLVGLAQVIPILLLTLPAGQLVDRHSRKTLILIATFIQILLWIAMGFSSRFATRLFSPAGPEASLFADPHVPILLGLLVLNGATRAVVQPARQSLLPLLVPQSLFPNAVTWNASLFETTNVIGPMIGGFALAALLGPSPHDTWAFSIIYWTNAALQLVQWINVLRIKITQPARAREPVTLKTMLAGIHFVWNTKPILGAITLDMFAVLLGGATALLPVFAKEVLHVGPVGLAWLRASPSAGAITMALLLAHAPPMKNAGRNLLWCVAGFGACTVVFGLSTHYWLSIVALFFAGAFDNISVVVRQTLVQLLTPDAMRGRVSAINSMFISSSNELGEFESGTTAHLASTTFALGPMWGPMAAVAAGGLGTIAVVSASLYLFPQIARIKSLTSLKAPEPEPVPPPQGFPIS